ncbi:ArnT family glycosyltransferase [Shewanella dokdonensis]|nr:glycosyltransferase family 39 protein [Shewanella dokdonensis]MCL1074771.1 glycosyltransferase family 39 protein [Shewanella dokdonensis]
MSNRLINQAKNTLSLTPLTFLGLTCLVALMLIAAHLWLRPLMPVDETRYVSVAWEMWRDHNWLVPHQNGETYAHKPPLLFWLINLFWLIFGVNEWPARLSIPLFSCLNFALLYVLARKYFPQSENAASYAPVLLLALAGWNFYLPTVMFDLVLSVFVLLWLLSTLGFSYTGAKRFMLLGGLAIGLGLLTKGPVMLLYAVPFMLLRPWWQPHNSMTNGQFFRGSLIAILLGLVLLSCWVIPAVIAGGGAYENELIWKQTAGRVVTAFAHARPFYWYLYLLPVLLLPIPLLGGIWRSRIFHLRDNREQALLCYILIIVLCFSLISGKQLHYLCPLMPLIALFFAAKLQPEKFAPSYLLAALCVMVILLLGSLPLWADKVFKNLDDPKIALWVIVIPLLLLWLSLWRCKQQRLVPFVHLLVFPLLITSMLLAVRQPLHEAYDITAAAQQVRQLQEQGNKLAFWDKYDNQFQFAGRLQQPIVELQDADISKRLHWLKEHPQAIVIYPVKQPADVMLKQALYSQPYRGRVLLLLRAADFVPLMSVAH